MVLSVPLSLPVPGSKPLKMKHHSHDLLSCSYQVSKLPRPGSRSGSCSRPVEMGEVMSSSYRTMLGMVSERFQLNLLHPSSLSGLSPVHAWISFSTREL